LLVVGKFSGDSEDTDDRRIPVSPPAGVIGKSLPLERSPVEFEEENEDTVSEIDLVLDSL